MGFVRRISGFSVIIKSCPFTCSFAYAIRLRGSKYGNADCSEEHAKGNPEVGVTKMVTVANGMFLRSQHNDMPMRTPKPDSVTWKKKRQNTSSEEQTLVSSAVPSLNKFSDDGSFMEKISNLESNDTNASIASAGAIVDEQRYSSQRSHKETSSVVQLVSIQKLNANQMAAKILQLQMKGKQREAEQLWTEMETLLENQDTAHEKSGHGKEKSTISIRHTLKPSADDRRREEDSDMHLA